MLMAAVKLGHDVVNAAVDRLKEKRVVFETRDACEESLDAIVHAGSPERVPFIDQIELWGEKDDMALAISTSGKSPNLIYALESARQKGMLTIAFSGKDGGRMPEVTDYCFTVPSFSIHRIQESHVALLHILWDLTHVALGEEDII